MREAIIKISNELRASSFVENPVGVRHHLPGLGIDVLGDSGRRARDAAVPDGRAALHRRRPGALSMDEVHRCQIPRLARVARRQHSGHIDVPD